MNHPGNGGFAYDVHLLDDVLQPDTRFRGPEYILKEAGSDDASLCVCRYLMGEIQLFHCDSARAEIDWLGDNVRSHDPDPRLLICHYRDPAVIFGLSQRPDKALQERLDHAGVCWLRRRSGGGIVYAGPWMLGVSLVLPVDHPLSAMEPVQAYGWFGELWRSLLAQLGVDSKLPDRETIRASRREAESRDIDWACYGAMGHGEVGSNESVMRKVVGIAQIRTRAASTLVAGLHLAMPDWHALCALLEKPREQAAYLAQANTSLADLAPPGMSPSTPSLVNRVEDIFLPMVRHAADPGSSDSPRP